MDEQNPEQATDQASDTATAELASPSEILINTLEDWRQAFFSNLPRFAVALIVFIVVWLLAGFISKWLGKLISRGMKNRSLISLTQSVIKIVIIGAGLFLALGIMGLDQALTTLLTGAGIAGLAIGFAIQNPMGNTFAGVLLSLRDNINIGDWIESNSYAGEVVQLDLKATTLKGPDNNIIVLPNKEVLDKPYKNHSLTNRSRVIITCGVGYGSDLKRVKEIVLDTLDKTFDIVSREDVIFYYDEFADSSINFTARFWMQATSSIEVSYAKSTAIMAIKEAFDANDINIPFPIRTIITEPKS